MRSDTTIQPSGTSPSTVAQCSSVDQQVFPQLAWMKIMLSSFLGPRQETTRTAFCNYLPSEMEDLEDIDFQTCRNEAVKLLSSIQSRAEERSHQYPTRILKKDNYFFSVLFVFQDNSKTRSITLPHIKHTNKIV